MGAVAAVGAGLSVVSGIMGASQQSKQAAAERKALDAQYSQQKLGADLQLFALRNQRLLDDTNDKLVDAANKAAYLQTDAALRTQQLTNDLAVSNALFQSGVQKAQGDIERQQAQIGASKAQSDAVAAAGAQALEAYANSSQEEQAVINSIIDGVSKSGDRETAIARLLNMAAASGGINEALANIAGGDAFSGLRSSAELQRASELAKSKQAAGQQVADASLAANRTEIGMNLANADLKNTGTQLEANLSALDANTSKQVADLGFASQRTANDANYRIGIISNEQQRASRYLTSQANEEALVQGVALSGDIINAQKSAIRSPGLFDYVGIGFNAYNTYQQLNYVSPSSSVKGVQPQQQTSGSRVINQGQDYYRLNAG